MLFVFQRLFAGLWLERIFKISFDYTPGMIVGFIGFSILVGLIAGLLPSLYVSLFNPITVLKGMTGWRPFKRLTLRKVLLVVQFCVSLIFVISVSLIYLQGDHVLHFNYGFDKENVVNIKLFKSENYDRFAQAISGDKRIGAVSACVYPPATGSNSSEMVRRAAPLNDSLHADYLDIDAGCLKVWNLKLVAGRNLPAIPAEKDDQYVLINERMVRQFAFGSAGRAVGQHLVVDGRDLEVLGVVKDFQFLDVNREMEPLLLRNRKDQFGYITVRVQGRDLAGAVSFMQQTWKKVNPNSKFDYEFFDQQLLMTHSMMTDAAGVLGVLAFLAVVISCLGLLGMATYIAESRRKEISLRKVLGSSVPQVLLLLSRGFMALLAIAVVISVPLAYLVNGMWLRFFASRISISPWVLLLNVLLLAGVCLLIIFSQTWRVARANPADSLRAE
jgi:putative ABC transport system permease protein